MSRTSAKPNPLPQALHCSLHRPRCGRPRCPERRPARGGRGQQGYSLVEVSVVTAIVLLLAVIGVPAINNYVMENRVPKVGEALLRFVLHAKVAVSGEAAAPYSVLDTALLARHVRDSGLLVVTGNGAGLKVSHGLGQQGEVTLAPGDGGDSLVLTLDRVHHAACPGIASVLQRVADTITITAPTLGTAQVKGAHQAYNALAAQSHCEPGAVNTLVFTGR